MTEPKKLERATVIVGLPASVTPWCMRLFNGDVIAVSVTKGAYIIRNGKAEPIAPGVMGQNSGREVPKMGA